MVVDVMDDLGGELGKSSRPVNPAEALLELNRETIPYLAPVLLVVTMVVGILDVDR